MKRSWQYVTHKNTYKSQQKRVKYPSSDLMHVHLFGHLKSGFLKDGLSNFGGILLLVHLNQILLILFLYPQVVCGPVYSQHGLQLSGEIPVVLYRII